MDPSIVPREKEKEEILKKLEEYIKKLVDVETDFSQEVEKYERKVKEGEEKFREYLKDLHEKFPEIAKHLNRSILEIGRKKKEKMIEEFNEVKESLAKGLTSDITQKIERTVSEASKKYDKKVVEEINSFIESMNKTIEEVDKLRMYEPPKRSIKDVIMNLIISKTIERGYDAGATLKELVKIGGSRAYQLLKELEDKNKIVKVRVPGVEVKSEEELVDTYLFIPEEINRNYIKYLDPLNFEERTIEEIINRTGEKDGNGKRRYLKRIYRNLEDLGLVRITYYTRGGKKSDGPRGGPMKVRLTRLGNVLRSLYNQ